MILAACGSPPAPPPAATPPEEPPIPSDARENLTIQPLYHATLALGAGGRTWIVDPWSKAPLSDKTADVVLITDIHEDHLDPKAIAAVSKPGTVIVGPAAVADKTHVDVVISNGETKAVDGVDVTAVPMYNLVRGPEA